jgi:protein-disulfide isomerase
MTRRAFLQGTALVTLGVAAAASLPGEAFRLLAEAQAQGQQQAISPLELMQPGPLPDISLGEANAPVTIIEYASMTCTHCATFHTTVYPVLKSRYIDTGKVRYILREFPLDPLAAGAFMLARCGPQDKHYQLIETMFKEQKNWAFVQNPLPQLLKIAKEQAGYNEQSFEKCLSNQKLLDDVDATRRRGAEKFGVSSTPTFFINGKIYKGALTVDDLDKQIQPLLKS